MVKNLKVVDGLDTLTESYSIIYGTFIHRLRNTEDRFDRYDEIEFKNVETGELYSMKTKREFFRKEYYLMVFFIPPGKYILNNYFYTRSTLFKQKLFKEPILRPIVGDDSTNSNKYIIHVKENSLNFIGNWDFSAKFPKFTNKKNTLDVILKPIYPRLNLDSAIIALPQ